MPWFPDFVSAVELARRQSRAAGQADPVGQYVAALDRGDTHALEDVWPGEVVVHDPRAGEVRGHKQLRQFVRRSQSLLAERHARIETVASTVAGDRAVVELLVHLFSDEWERQWPVAIVAESPDERSAVFRSYLSQWPVAGRRYLRRPVLEAGRTRPGGVVGRYQSALAAGDVDGVMGVFAPDGYLRESLGPQYVHRGSAELRSYFQRCFSTGGGISLVPCAFTDDGVRCAVEYNCVRWGGLALPPQAGIAVHERGADGLLTAVRVYDDVEAPFERPERVTLRGLEPDVSIDDRERTSG
jgi:ketosteroid isomerase-like protein